MIAEEMQPLLDILRSVFPDGAIAAPDYWALLTVLYDDMSDRQLASVVAELTNGVPVVVNNDIADAIAHARADDRDVTRVRQMLVDAGWRPDFA